jgi:hypothetical protein
LNEKEQQLESLPLWVWGKTKENEFDDQCEKYAAFVTENKRRPKYNEKFDDWKIGIWQSTQRGYYKKRRETKKNIPLDEKEQQLESLPLWVWWMNKNKNI